eukprot:m.112787 g.112787  ORF g.112787 m.112787 type:complete len:456 (+) comp21441_c0_seq3:123-1490(+)
MADSDAVVAPVLTESEPVAPVLESPAAMEVEAAPVPATDPATEVDTAVVVPPPPPPAAPPPAAPASPAQAPAPPSGVCINGVRFQSPGEMLDALKAMQGKLEDDQELEGAQAFLVYDLLTYHPTVADKVKDGVVAIGWGVNPEFPDTRSFFCRLASGEKIPWSARKCIDAIFPREDGRETGGRDAKRKRERESRVGTAAGFCPGSILHFQNLPPGTRIGEVKGLFPAEFEVRFAEMLDPEDPTEDNHMSAIARFPSAAACARAAEADLPLVELGPDIVFGVASTEVETAVWSRMQEAQAAKRLRQEKEDAPAQVTVVPGCLLHVTGLTAELNDIPILKRVFSEVKGVRYVEKLGDDAVLIRYASPEDCTASAAITSVDGTDVTVAIASGDTEKGFWDRMQESIVARHARDKEQRGGGWGGGNRRGGGGFNKRRGGGGYGGRRGGGGGRGRGRGRR